MELLVIGGVALDYLSKVRSLKDPCSEVLEYSENLGGMAYNTAATASSLGAKTRLVSSVGKDFPPLEDREGLKFDLGVGDKPTTRSFLFYDGREERIYFYRGAYHDIDVKDAKKRIAGAGWVHFAGVAPCFSELIGAADAQDKIVSCNPGYDLFHYRPEDEVVGELADKSDYFVMSSDEARHLNRPVDSILGEAAVITMGKNGSALVTKEGRVQIPAYKTEVISPFGAGDVYTGAFIASMAKGGDALKSARLASAAASFAVEERSTTPKLDWKGVEKRAKRL